MPLAPQYAKIWLSSDSGETSWQAELELLLLHAKKKKDTNTGKSNLFISTIYFFNRHDNKSIGCISVRENIILVFLFEHQFLVTLFIHIPLIFFIKNRCKY